jgi:hypothetical protein
LTNQNDNLNKENTNLSADKAKLKSWERNDLFLDHLHGEAIVLLAALLLVRQSSQSLVKLKIWNLD